MTSKNSLVNVDTFELKISVSVIGSSGIKTMFLRENFPELGT